MTEGYYLMSNGKEFHKIMCRERDCLMSGGKDFHKLIVVGIIRHPAHFVRLDS